MVKETGLLSQNQIRGIVGHHCRLLTYGEMVIQALSYYCVGRLGWGADWEGGHYGAANKSSDVGLVCTQLSDARQGPILIPPSGSGCDDRTAEIWTNSYRQRDWVNLYVLLACSTYCVSDRPCSHLSRTLTPVKCGVIRKVYTHPSLPTTGLERGSDRAGAITTWITKLWCCWDVLRH